MLGGGFDNVVFVLLSTFAFVSPTTLLALLLNCFGIPIIFTLLASLLALLLASLKSSEFGLVPSSISRTNVFLSVLMLVLDLVLDLVLLDLLASVTTRPSKLGVVVPWLTPQDRRRFFVVGVTQ